MSTLEIFQTRWSQGESLAPLIDTTVNQIADLSALEYGELGLPKSLIREFVINPACGVVTMTDEEGVQGYLIAVPTTGAYTGEMDFCLPEARRPFNEIFNYFKVVAEYERSHPRHPQVFVDRSPSPKKGYMLEMNFHPKYRGQGLSRQVVQTMHESLKGVYENMDTDVVANGFGIAMINDLRTQNLLRRAQRYNHIPSTINPYMGVGMPGQFYVEYQLP